MYKLVKKNQHVGKNKMDITKFMKNTKRGDDKRVSMSFNPLFYNGFIALATKCDKNKIDYQNTNKQIGTTKFCYFVFASYLEKLGVTQTEINDLLEKL